MVGEGGGVMVRETSTSFFFVVRKRFHTNCLLHGNTEVSCNLWLQKVLLLYGNPKVLDLTTTLTSS